MDIFDEVYKKVTDAASYTAKETEKLTEKAKLKYNLMREKNKLDDAYKALGEIYYNQLKNSETDENKTASAYDKIEKSISEIERLKFEIALISNTKCCVACGEKLGKEMVFCPYCGVDQNKADN